MSPLGELSDALLCNGDIFTHVQSLASSKDFHFSDFERNEDFATLLLKVGFVSSLINLTVSHIFPFLNRDGRLAPYSRNPVTSPHSLTFKFWAQF